MTAERVTLRWEGEGERFRGAKEGGPEIVLDGSGGAGPSPVSALALALAGCMAVDVLDITTKMRLSLRSLEVAVSGERAPDPPRRFTALRLVYRIAGIDRADESKVWKAIDLSRDKYCSVWHSLRQDIALTIELELG